MNGERQLEVAEGMVIPPAEVLTVCFLHALCREPIGDLVVANNHGAGALGNRDAIAHVVAVSMTDEDVIRLDHVGFDGRGGVSRQERIDNDFVPICFQPQSGMTIPGQFCRHKNLLLELSP
jgi:hypothetical protein